LVPQIDAPTKTHTNFEPNIKRQTSNLKPQTPNSKRFP